MEVCLKTFKIIPFIILVLFIIGCSTTPEREKVLSERKVVWLGIDYSLAKFSNIEESPDAVLEKLSAINNVVVNEAGKYNVKKYFKKSEVTYDLTIVNSNNSKIDPAKLVTSGIHSITSDDVKKLISSYNIRGKTGMGLVFVAENMNKSKKTGSYYVCFFDLSTKDIIDSERVQGKASGFGLRNFWARSVLEVMKRWN
jgi:hypothetical protein